MTTQDVDAAIIRPMRAVFPAPTHVRSDPAAREELLNVYRRALERFGRRTLEQAWQEAASEQDFWLWPLPEAIVKAAERIHALAYPKIKADDGWVEKATTLTDAYTRRFMATAQAGIRSREAGYEAQLKSYVREVSWVQSQMILGREHIGYVSGVLFPGKERDKRAEDEFFARAREQAETGSIRVRVPHSLIERWRQGVEKGRSR